MAGPTTEVLNEDVKELRERVHSLEVTMARGFGEVRGEIKDLRGEIKEMRSDLQGEIKELRAEVHSAIRVAVWGMGIFATVVVGLVVFAVSASWYASKIDSRLNQLERNPPRTESQPR